MSVRVYVAAGPEGVASLEERGIVTGRMFAVSDAMRRREPDVDEEELEYEASLDAEAACRAAGVHVVVVAADVTAVDVTDAGEVRGAPEVPLRSVVSFHVAEHGAPEDEEPLWYDASEIDEVASYLRG